MNSQSLYECILDAYTTFNINAFPIDCFKVVEKCGFKTVKYSDLNSKKKTACKMLSEDACLLEETLFYESNVHPRRIQFSIAHEFGHVLLKTNDEDKADEFASHFLAPRILIHKNGCKNANEIHDTFGLSYQASNRALTSYKKWYHNIACSDSRKPTEPEIQLEHIFFPESNLAPLTQGIIQSTKHCHEYDEEDYCELDECSTFMEFLASWREDLGFKNAENKWLYGNDF